jgi:hypothetical protein
MTPARPAPSIAPETPAAQVLDLHRWRRLDWRFLLPTGTLDRIACGGAVDEELRAALPLLTPDIREPRDAAEWGGLAGSCDAVVLVRPTRDQLPPALAALRPGGWLYAEVARRTPIARPATVAGWRAAFIRAGLQDVSAYWHLPGPHGPSALVALDAGTALRHLVGRHGEGRLSASRARLAGALLDVRLLAHAIEEGAVAGRRPLAPS